MASSNWRTGCVREEREKELAFANGDTRRTNDHCENLGEVDKENQGNAETQVVLTRLREKRKPPPLRIVEPKEDVSGINDQIRLPEVDQLDNQLVLGLAGLRLASPPPCPQAT